MFLPFPTFNLCIHMHIIPRGWKQTIMILWHCDVLLLSFDTDYVSKILIFYSTCTLTRREAEGRWKGFLKCHSSCARTSRLPEPLIFQNLWSSTRLPYRLPLIFHRETLCWSSHVFLKPESYIVSLTRCFCHFVRRSFCAHPLPVVRSWWWLV